MLRKNWPFIYTLLLLFGDFVFFNLAFVVAIYLRFDSLSVLPNYREPLLIANLLFFPLSISLGVFRSVHQAPLENQKAHLRRFAVYLGLFLMSYLFLTKGHNYSRGVVLIFLMAQFFFLEMFHLLMYRLNRFLSRKGFGRKSTLIVGTDSSARSFFEQLQEWYGDRYQIRGFVANGRVHMSDPAIKPYIVGKYEEMDTLIKEYQVDQVFIVSDSMLQKKYETIRKACEVHHVPVKMVSPIIRNLMKQIKVKDISGVPLTTHQEYRYRYRTWQSRLKRALDITVVLIASVVLVPVGLLIAALIKITSRGPVFFKQKRALYKGGPEFWFYKFRTMYVDAEERKKALLEKNETNGALFKMKNDPRVTPIGRILRKYSLDELPQFINVLKGEMSIVGPRPLPVSDFDLLKNGKMNYDWYQKRGLAKPGITGLWQISGRSHLSFEEMVLLDLYYIENQSIFFDLEIMFETLPVVFFGKGAY